MKKLVISLLRRTDRKRNFQRNNLKNYKWIEAVDGKDHIFRDCKGRQDWKNPFNGRELLQNEVACLLSHASAWEKVAQQKEPMMILEDDAVINEHWNEDYYKEVMRFCDFLYLQRNENEPEKVKPCPKDVERELDRYPGYIPIEIPSFPYNLTAYCLTPKGAKILLEALDLQDVIPADDFVPSCFDIHNRIYETALNVFALKQDSCNQLGRDSWSGTDIEESPIFRNFKIHVLTAGDDRKRCSQLNSSAMMYGIDIVNLANNVEWQGTDMAGPGGGHKVNMLKAYIKNLPEDDIVLFTDAFDVFYGDDINTIYERYVDLSHSVIFGAEMYIWPDETLAPSFPKSKTPYRFLNSGTIMGRVKDLNNILRYKNIKNDDDDQLFFQEIFLKQGKEFDIGLDYEGYLFQTHDPEMEVINGQLNNPRTKCCPCIYHGNGGSEAKAVFNNLYDQMFPNKSPLFIPNMNKFEFLSDDMLLINFMTQDQCERLIELADKNGEWGSLNYDKFPAQEIRMKELGLWDELEQHWNTHVVPLCEHYWQPLQMYGLRDGFVMRYAMDTQTNLNLHHDASLVTGSVKLNDDYEGAELVYPRQNISNKDIPVGKCILFPGQVSHGHECLPLTKGVKYSLTIWTCRYVNDTI